MLDYIQSVFGGEVLAITCVRSPDSSWF